MRKPFLIIIDGPMGSGKSTIGALIHKRLKGTVIINTGLLKIFLSDFKGIPAEYQLLVSLMMKITKECLDHGISVIIPQGFWKKKYTTPYLRLAKEKKVRLFFYQLEAPEKVLIKRIGKRKKAEARSRPDPRSLIMHNMKKWADNRYELGKVFDTSKLSAEKIAGIILKDVKTK